MFSTLKGMRDGHEGTGENTGMGEAWITGGPKRGVMYASVVYVQWNNRGSSVGFAGDKIMLCGSFLSSAVCTMLTFFLSL